MRLHACLRHAIAFVLILSTVSACGGGEFDRLIASRKSKVVAAQKFIAISKQVKAGDASSAKAKAPELAVALNAMAEAARERWRFAVNSDPSSLSPDQKAIDGQLMGEEEAVGSEFGAAIDSLGEANLEVMGTVPDFRVAIGRLSRWNDEAFASGLFVYRLRAYQALDQMQDALAQEHACEWLQQYVRAREMQRDDAMNTDFVAAGKSIRNPEILAVLNNPQQRALVFMGAQAGVGKICEDKSGWPIGWMSRVKSECGPALDRINAIRRSEGRDPID